jgi:hypothetical protein
MTSHPSQRPVSALRERMIEDMTVRGFNEKTRGDYVRNVRALAAFIGRSPDTATAEDLRRFQLHQTQAGLQPPSINSAVSALRFFFTVTLDRPDLAERRGGRASAPGSAGTEVQDGARHRIWRRAAPLRGGCAQSRRRRFRAYAPAGREGQGPQGPPRHAIATAPRAAACLVAGGPTPGRVAAAGLAVPGPQPGRAALDPSAQPRRPRRRRRRRDQEAGDAAHAAAPRTCLNRTPTSASFKCCSATPSSTPPLFTPASPTPRSAP